MNLTVKRHALGLRIAFICFHDPAYKNRAREHALTKFHSKKQPYHGVKQTCWFHFLERELVARLYLNCIKL